jgi:lipopolysaccharide biosynthesis glycosyltransferase
MKYVYVLTSSDTDYYYEQFLQSITSLRLYNPDTYILALIDSKTKENLIDKRAGYEQIVSEAIIIQTPEELSQREVSRWIKTSMKIYVIGDFLYIDCDTVITQNLDYNFPPEINIGAVLDTHVPLSKHHLSEYFKNEDKKLSFTSSLDTGKRYNGGIIFCRDTPLVDTFFLKWHSLWQFSNKNGNHHDMPSLNQANFELGDVITELSGELNCQITHNGLSYLYNAKIIHYYATAFTFICCPFIPATNTILSQIKETGIITPEIMELLKNPKAAFEHDSRIISGEAELDVVNSKLFSLLLRIRKRKPNVFKAFNSFIIRLLSIRQ